MHTRKLRTWSPALAFRNVQRPSAGSAGELTPSAIGEAASTLLPVATLKRPPQLCRNVTDPGPTVFECVGRETPKASSALPPPGRLAVTRDCTQRAFTIARAAAEPVFSSVKRQPCALGTTAAGRTSPRLPPPSA
jgi:hypothetical protein